MEGSDPDASIFRYRFVINQASSARDLYLVVPAYLRLVGLLERLRRHEDALEVIQGFEKRYEGKKSVAPFPTEAQRGAISVHKSRIVMMQRQPTAVAT